MNYITTTQLRTQTPDLLEALLYGQSVDLIHRSKPVATISPKKVSTKKFNAKRFMEIVKRLNFTPATDEQIEKRYRTAMIKKHGEYIH